MSDMTNKEAIEMMQRCKAEIEGLRRDNERLRPKAEAYESIQQILSLMPHRSMGMSEDMVWILDKRIRELEPKVKVNDV